MPPDREIDRILEAHCSGDAGASNRLAPIVYEELRRLAAQRMHGERPDHSLDATALVHEVYLRLVDQDRVDWRGRRHFLAVAAQIMPRVLIDHARRAGTAKRGRGRQRVSLEGALDFATPQQGAGTTDVDALDLAEALETLRDLNARQARIVELRFLGGMSVEETAFVLGVSGETVKRDTRFARAWLRNKLRDEADR